MRFERRLVSTGLRATLWATLTSATALSASLTVARAQSGEEAPEAITPASPALEEIIITSRRREESLQDVPIAVSVVGKAELARANVRTLTDLDTYAPNVVIDEVQAIPNGIALSIRGISFQDVEKSFDPAIGVVLDGVYLGTNTGALLDSFDLERIEILRGPQGITFGRNNTAGTLNIVRTRPTLDWGARASVTAGSQDRFDARFIGNVPIIEGELGIKGGFFYKSDTGFYFNDFNGEEEPEEDVINGTVAMLWEPSDNFDFYLIYDRIRDRSEITPLINVTPDNFILASVFGQPGQEFGELTRTISQNFDNAADFDLHAVTAEANWDLGPVILTSITGWRAQDEFVAQDFDSAPVDFFSTFRPQDYNQFSQELQLNTDFSERFNLLFGLYYFYGEYDLNQRTLSPLFNLGLGQPPQPFGVGIEQRLDTGQETDSYAAYTQANYDVTDKLTLTLGGRITYEEKTFTQFSRFFDPQTGMTATLFIPGVGEVPLIQGDFTSTEDWTDFSPMGSVQYQPSPDRLFYASITTGFKSGGFSGRSTTPETAGPYDPEEVIAYEAGFKTQWLDSRLVINGAVFFNDYDDLQVELVVPDEAAGQQTIVVNAQESEFFGAEMEFVAHLTEQLRLSGNVGWLDSDIKEFTADVTGENSPFPDGQPDDLSFLEQRRAPDWTFALLGEYDLYFDAIDTAMTARLEYTYQADYQTVISLDPFFVDNPELFVSEATGLLDLAVDFVHFYDNDDQQRDIRLTAFVNNLTDEDRLNSALVVTPLFAFATLQAPRVWGVELAVSY